MMGGGLGVLAGPGTASATGCAAFGGAQPPAADVGDGSEFTAVTAAGPCDAWMVGHNSNGPGGAVALIEHWAGGASWTAVSPPSTPGNAEALLAGVSAVSQADVWAVGALAVEGVGASGLALHWDGTSWVQRAVPGSVNSLNAVAAVSASDVWAAGSSHDNTPMLLHYDGTSWTRWLAPPLTPAPAGAAIYGLAAISADDVWAVGAMDLSSETDPVVLHWNGTAWSQVHAPGDGYYLEAVSGTGPGDAWAVGTSQSRSSTVILHWDGTNWIQKPSPSPGQAQNELMGVASISPTSAVAVGAGSASGQQPLVLHWDGHTWTQMTPPGLGQGSGLNAVTAGPAGVWAAGWRYTPGIKASATVFGTVPSVTGDTPAAATDAVSSAGLTSTITDVTTAGGGCSPAANGTVFATSPPAGAFTAPPVNLSVCDMPPIVTVPNVVGLDDSQAQGTLTSAGLTTGTVTLSGNCEFPPGTVIRQTPAAGTSLNRGSAVNLVEATLPKPHGCAQ